MLYSCTHMATVGVKGLTDSHGPRDLRPVDTGCVHKLNADNRTGISWITRKLSQFMNDWLLPPLLGQLIGTE